MNNLFSPWPRAPFRRRSQASGFSLLEVVVSLGVMSIVLIAALRLIDSGSELTRSQGDVADLQNHQRVAQQEMIRMLGMAGLGGLPEGVDPALAGNSSNSGVFPDGLAVAVANNAPANARLAGLTTPLLVEGSDVLTVRGVFTTPVYFIEPQQALTLDGNGRVSMVIETAPDVGVRQDLEPLRRELTEAINATPPRPEAVIVRDRFNPGAFAVLELDPTTTALGAAGSSSLTIGLILSSVDTLQTYADEYGRMILGTTLLQGSGGSMVPLPQGGTVQLPSSIGSIGLLEEYRFYVRQEWDVAGDPTSRAEPVLSRARFYPGTGALHPDGSIDVAAGVLDLQIALGVDLPPGDGRVADGVDASGLPVDLDADEVLYNDPDDDDGLSPPPGARSWAVLAAQVVFVRLSTVVQAPRPDRVFEGRALGTVEDHDLAASGFNTAADLKTRKRHLRTTVRLRNLS